MLNNWKMRITVVCLSACMALLLVSCSSHRVPHVNRTIRGTVVGALSGAATGTLVGAGVGTVMGAFIGYDIQRRIPELLRVEEQISAQGINIIKLGETITLVLPADHYFIQHSPRLASNAAPTLKLIDEYIRFFDTVRIDVTAYTDNVGDKQRNAALSRQRAQEVIDFMWRDKSDMRLLVAKGLGVNAPIASNRTDSGRAKNRRVEISFRIYNTEQIFVA